ncbi:MAG: hypothetical protein M3N43_05370 [Actinomycetota bacterium]|nr:hypothetical protein [Actinomycetota bacterium]
MLHALLAALLLQAPAAPDTSGSLMTNAGVVRAAGAVDSVFVARSIDSALIDHGDWTAYLMARLGIRPIPTMGIRVAEGEGCLRIHGALRDIPPEGRAALSTLISLFDPATRFTATITLDRPAARAIRFRLDAAWLADFPIPEAVLAPGLRMVGEKYPVLANGGRELFVEIPVDGQVTLTPQGVLLRAPKRP